MIAAWTDDAGKVTARSHTMAHTLIVQLRGCDHRMRPCGAFGWIGSWGADDDHHVLYAERTHDGSGDLYVRYEWTRVTAEGTEQDPRRGGGEWRIAPTIEAAS